MACSCRPTVLKMRATGGFESRSNNRERQIGTYLFGRKMYETMAVWETPDVIPHLPAAALEFAPIWQAAEKIVYSTTLQTVSTAKTRIERRFEPDIVRELKAGATRDVAVGGPALAAYAIRAGPPAARASWSSANSRRCYGTL